MYEKFTKRILDIVLSAVGLVVLSPVYLIISIAIIADDPGPILFKQKRVGIHKNYFTMMKFRTMKVDTPHDVPTHMLRYSDQYITRVGKIMRKTSLDELPQIAQILTGKMSIIGPRPALWNQYDLIEERDRYGANDVMPGLSGWAQVNGRDTISISEKARFDGEYAANVSFKFGCKCFFKTVINVLKRVGIVEGEAAQVAGKE